jgi:hypothetical protein
LQISKGRLKNLQAIFVIFTIVMIRLFELNTI